MAHLAQKPEMRAISQRLEISGKQVERLQAENERLAAVNATLEAENLHGNIVSMGQGNIIQRTVDLLNQQLQEAREEIQRLREKHGDFD